MKQVAGVVNFYTWGRSLCSSITVGRGDAAVSRRDSIHCFNRGLCPDVGSHDRRVENTTGSPALKKVTK